MEKPPISRWNDTGSQRTMCIQLVFSIEMSSSRIGHLNDTMSHADEVRVCQHYTNFGQQPLSAMRPQFTGKFERRRRFAIPRNILQLKPIKLSSVLYQSV